MPIRNLIKKTLKSKGPLNILSFFYDGKFDIELLTTGHNFYGFKGHSAYQWQNYKTDYSNLHLLDQPLYHLNSFDFAVINQRDRQRQFLNICQSLHLPVLLIDHDFSRDNAYQRHQKKLPFDSVSTNKFVQKQFDNELINYAINQNEGQYLKDIDVLMCGNFSQNDFGLIQQIKTHIPNSKIIGNNLPFSEEISTYEDYKALFPRAKVYINLASQENIPYELLWAQRYNCFTISNEIPPYELLKESNLFKVVSSLEEIINLTKMYINKPQIKTTLDLSQHNDVTFQEQWNKKFEQFRNRIYTI